MPTVARLSSSPCGWCVTRSPDADRGDPPLVGDERAMLVGWLDWHRDTLAVKCQGLSDEQLAQRSASPSLLSLIGLVRHMSELERAYFRRMFAGEDVPWLYSTDEDPERDFVQADASSARESYDTWTNEVRIARAIIAETESLDDTGKSRMPMRSWLVKTLNEYARHNGHADLLRERIDGMTGE